MAAGYLLDTSIVAETRKTNPNPGIMEFIGRTDATLLYLSVLTIGELRRAIGARRASDAAAAQQLDDWVDGLETQFADRILPVDVAAARLWGDLSAGRNLPVIDTLIAATAMTRNLMLVTRKARDVETTGVALVDPWR
jgi:toxin FitB